MRHQRQVVRDDKADDDDHDHDYRGHGQRKVPLLDDDHPQLHAQLHAGQHDKRGLLRLCDRQALEQRVESRLRSYRAHRQSGSASRESDQAGDGLLRRNELN
jgi:hypothetical protein